MDSNLGILKFCFIDVDTAHAASIACATTKKWIFYLIYTDKRIINFKIGCVPPEIMLEW